MDYKLHENMYIKTQMIENKYKLCLFVTQVTNLSHVGTSRQRHECVLLLWPDLSDLLISIRSYL
jgi:hypothetical protein